LKRFIEQITLLRMKETKHVIAEILIREQLYFAHNNRLKDWRLVQRTTISNVTSCILNVALVLIGNNFVYLLHLDSLLVFSGMTIKRCYADDSKRRLQDSYSKAKRSS
jgi:hypothetical protein